MRLIQCVILLVCLAASANTPRWTRAWTVTPRNSVAIDTTAAPAMSELSGLAYIGPLGGSSHEVYAVQDSGDQLVRLSLSLSTSGTLNSAAATVTKTLAPGHDFEGVALGPAGSVLVSEEDTPAVRRYDSTSGAVTATLAMPAVYASCRPNFGFESLTQAPDGLTYWTANEEALTPDGPQSTPSAGTTVRLQKFTYDAAGTLAFGPQYAYNVDPIHTTSTNSASRSGLVDIVALPDSSLLALERSAGGPLLSYENRIYRVTFGGATDVSQSPFSTGLIGQSYISASKSLLWKGQVGGPAGQNMEGLALGPQLTGGDWLLLGVVDDGGLQDFLSGNTLAAFILSPTIPGDFNGNGTVDSADYVAWRNGLGTTFVVGDYNVWRSHFGQSAGSGANGDWSGASTVPEPTAAAMLVSVQLLALCCGRARVRS